MEPMRTYRIIYHDSDGRRHTEYGTFAKAGLGVHLEELEESGCRNIIVTAFGTQEIGMAYSRWSDSYWYTYWCVGPVGEKETRDNAIFCVCGVEDFTDEQIRENLDGCIEKVLGITADFENKPETEDVEELRGYMRQFLADVELRREPSE